MNKLKMAPLSAPSMIPRPTHMPARTALIQGLPARRVLSADKARNADMSVSERVPRPQQVLEKKFMFSAAAIAATPQRPGDNLRVRKKIQALAPSSSRVMGG